MKKFLLFLALLLAPSLALRAQTFIGNNPDHGPNLPTTCSQSSGQTFFLTAVQGGNQPGLYSCINGAFITPSSAPTGSFNVLPSVVSVGAVNAIGAGTTFTITPPASIVNGNLLVAVLAVAGQNAETWTPAAGFTQIGSTVGNASGDKIALAVFSKVAASESGNYVFTFNNGASGIGVAVILQLSGTTAVDTSLTANANAATLNVSSFAVTNANDLVLAIGVHTNGNPITNVSTPNTATQQVLNNGMFIASYPNGATPVPAFNFVTYLTATPAAAGTVNAFAGFVLAFTPTVTSTTTPFTPNSANASSSSAGINITGGIQASGIVTANAFLIANSAAATALPNSYGLTAVDGYAFPAMGINISNNMCIDCNEVVGAVVIGNGIKGGPILRVASGKMDMISVDAAQDLQTLTSDASNNLIVGCATAACTGATQQNDVIINAQTNKVLRFRNNFADVATVTGTGLSSTSFQTATNCSSSAAPAVCGSAAAGSFVIAAAGTLVTVNTTAVTANSQIFVQEDESLGTKLSVTCNTGILANPPAITARTAATSFAVGITAGLAVNPVCFSYWVVN